MKLTTKVIVNMIPGWLTPEVEAHLRTQYVDNVDVEFADLRSIKYWKRDSKETVGKFDRNRDAGAAILRTFDHRLFDGTLRLYVYSDSTDTVVVQHYFQAE